VLKKRKLNSGKHIRVESNVPRKEKASDRGTIPIPNLSEDDENIELSDQDMAVFTDFGQAVGFLKKLDHKGLMRYTSLVLICVTFFFIPNFYQEQKGDPKTT
jgi:nucleolar complex protein 3